MSLPQIMTVAQNSGIELVILRQMVLDLVRTVKNFLQAELAFVWAG